HMPSNRLQRSPLKCALSSRAASTTCKCGGRRDVLHRRCLHRTEQRPLPSRVQGEEEEQRRPSAGLHPLFLSLRSRHPRCRRQRWSADAGSGLAAVPPPPLTPTRRRHHRSHPPSGDSSRESEGLVVYGTPIEREEDTSARKRRAVTKAGQLRALPAWKQDVS